MSLEPATWVKLIALGLCLLLAATATAAQASLSYLNRTRLRHLLDSGVPRARAILKVFEEPTAVFSTVLVLGTLGVSGAIGSTILLALEPAFVDAWPLGALALVLAGLAALLVIQIVARTVAVARPESTALVLFGLLRAFGAILAPVLAPLRAIERAGLRMLGMDRVSAPGDVAEEELRMLVETVEESSALEAGEREMIHGIFELSERPAREVMVPRIDIVAEPREAAIRQVLDRIVASGHSRIPIYQDSVDNVVGIAYAKDVLRHLRDGRLDDPVAPFARQAYFVPETKKVDELLHDLRQKRVHMAIVIDEYGGTAGLLTIEDLLEEIVGEIQDEYDEHEEELFERIDERETVVDARAPIREVNETLNLHLNVDDFDTLGGMVYHELGKVPVVGDEVRVDSCLVTVLSTEGRRIKKLRLMRVEEPGDPLDG